MCHGATEPRMLVVLSRLTDSAGAKPYLASTHRTAGWAGHRETHRVRRRHGKPPWTGRWITRWPLCAYLGAVRMRESVGDALRFLDAGNVSLNGNRVDYGMRVSPFGRRNEPAIVRPVSVSTSSSCAPFGNIVQVSTKSSPHACSARRRPSGHCGFGKKTWPTRFAAATPPRVRTGRPRASPR